jgi:hypothetical protein
MGSDIARDQHRAELFRLEAADLLVHGADLHPLCIVQHRAIDGAGNMVFGKFRWAAGIDDRVELLEPGKDFLKGQQCRVFHARFSKSVFGWRNDSTHAL